MNWNENMCKTIGPWDTQKTPETRVGKETGELCLGHHMSLVDVVDFILRLCHHVYSVTHFMPDFGCLVSWLNHCGQLCPVPVSTGLTETSSWPCKKIIIESISSKNHVKNSSQEYLWKPNKGKWLFLL